MAELSRSNREVACRELDKIEDTLSRMSAWIDGATNDRQRAAIHLEDAASHCLAAAHLIERDLVRVAGMAHRRVLTSMPPNGAG